MAEAMIPHPSLGLQRLASDSKLPSKEAQLLQTPPSKEDTDVEAGPGSGLTNHSGPQQDKVSWNNKPITSKIYLCGKVSMRHLGESEEKKKRNKLRFLSMAP